MGQFWGENRSIKTISESVLNHFIRNVKYLPWPDPGSLLNAYDKIKILIFGPAAHLTQPAHLLKKSLQPCNRLAGRKAIEY
jgi:hypothetical protein